MALGRGATEGTLQGVVGERVDAAGDARVAAGGADGGGAGGEGAPGRGSAGALRRRHPLRPAPAAHPQGAPPSPPAACACPGATVCSPSLPAHLPLCHCCVRLPGGDSCEAGGACSDGSQEQCRPLQVALGAGGEGAPGRGTPHDVALARIRQGAAQPAPQVPPPPPLHLPLARRHVRVIALCNRQLAQLPFDLHLHHLPPSILWLHGRPSTRALISLR